MSKTRIKMNVGETMTRAHIEALVSELRGLAIAEQKILADKNKAIQAIEDRCMPELEKIANGRKPLVAVIKDWAEAHPQEFEKKKSIEFTHGTIGFRIGQFKLVMTTRAGGWAGALGRVQQWLPSFIRSSPEIDKEAIIAQRDDADLQAGLKLCGLKVTQDESFFVEPKLEQVEERVKEAA